MKYDDVLYVELGGAEGDYIKGRFVGIEMWGMEPKEYQILIFENVAGKLAIGGSFLNKAYAEGQFKKGVWYKVSVIKSYKIQALPEPKEQI